MIVSPAMQLGHAMGRIDATGMTIDQFRSKGDEMAKEMGIVITPGIQRGIDAGYALLHVSEGIRRRWPGNCADKQCPPRASGAATELKLTYQKKKIDGAQ